MIKKEGIHLFNGEQFNEGYFLLGKPVVVLLFSFKRDFFFIRLAHIFLFHPLLLIVCLLYCE